VSLSADSRYSAGVRGLLNQTLARFGYAKVPDPQEPEVDQVLLLHEFGRLLVQHEETLRQANTRAKLARALGKLLAQAREKVARDEAWAQRYAGERSEERAEVTRAAGNFVPADWRDL
jgi:hypothetical protein